MVKASSLYTTFVQCCNSCTLASYAVASHHFTGLDVYDFFLDYCRYFNIPASPGQNAEREYDKHFQCEWKSRTCRGYKIIEELHNNSPQGVFVQSKSNFDVQFIPQTGSCLQQIENRLKNDEALVSVAFAVPSQFDVHSCCVGFDKRGFYMIETRGSEPKTGIVPIPNIQYIHQSLGPLQDSLLMSANPTSKKSSGGN